MKIKVSKYWWKNLYIMTSLWIIIEFVLIYLMIESMREDRIILVSLMVIYTIICIYASFLPPKVFFMTIEMQGKIIKSYLWGKSKCEISVEQTIYYTIFKARESMFTMREYIVLSNEMFYLKSKNREGYFLGNFECKKQVIIPYNEKTKHLLEIEKWICVN